VSPLTPGRILSFVVSYHTARDWKKILTRFACQLLYTSSVPVNEARHCESAARLEQPPDAPAQRREPRLPHFRCSMLQSARPYHVCIGGFRCTEEPVPLRRPRGFRWKPRVRLSRSVSSQIFSSSPSVRVVLWRIGAP
jgi:hypothetical protein